MRRILVGIFVFITLSGCAKKYYGAINSKPPRKSTFSSSLIEKGTLNWYSRILTPPLEVERTYNVGKLSKQNILFYRGSGYIGDKNGWLYRIDVKDGKIEKLLKISHPIGFSGCISGRYLYFSDLNGGIYSYNLISGKLSSRLIGVPIYSSPACSKDGAYFLDSNQTLYALKKGNILWNYHFINSEIEMKGEASPVVNGKEIIVATDNGFLYEMEDGNLLRSSDITGDDISTTKDIDSTPAVDILGNIYLVATNGIIASLDKNFRFLWKKRGEPATAESVLSPNELVVSSLDGTILSYDTDTGNMLWKLKISEKPLISPAIMLDKIIYQPTLDGYIYAISEKGEILWNDKIDGSGFVSKPVFHNGFLYLSARSGTIYKLKSTK